MRDSAKFRPPPPAGPQQAATGLIHFHGHAPVVTKVLHAAQISPKHPHRALNKKPLVLLVLGPPLPPFISLSGSLVEHGARGLGEVGLLGLDHLLSQSARANRHGGRDTQRHTHGHTHGRQRERARTKGAEYVLPLKHMTKGCP